MKPLTLFSLLLALPFSLSAEPLIKLESETGEDLSRVELLNLNKEKTNALLRRADGVEFDTPLAYLSERSRQELLKTWTDHRSKINLKLAPLNQAIGLPLFAENGNIWNEPAATVAKRLKLPKESNTPFTSSYRRYVRGNTYQFAGATPKTAVAIGDHIGRTLSLSVIYANKGDTLSSAGAGEDHFKSSGNGTSKSRLEQIMDADAQAIAQSLTGVLGEPLKQRMLGQGNKKHNVSRWDWNGHSFLLANVPNEYVSLQVVRASFADGGGRFSSISDGDMRKRLKDSVTTLGNGDVYIKGIPMVDQGPKGYCAPATFERAMRHAGVPSDMYLLATLATTGGGGTNTNKLYEEIAFTTRSKGGRTARKIKLDSLAPKKLKRYIEKGVPVLWQMCSLSNYNQIANSRTRARRGIKNWAQYAEKIAAEAEENSSKLQESGNYHICMIIGYNETTQELAVSDSWGKNYSMRWIHIDEAEAVSRGNGFVIDL